MSRDQSLYESWQMPDPNFPVKLQSIYFAGQCGNIIFSNHWHEKIEFLYFTKGEAVIQCNSVPIHVREGELIVVNSNDLHQGQSLSEELEYYCIIVETSLLQSKSADACEIKYITPISENSILFKNKVNNDNDIQITIDNIIKEYELQRIGFELAVKSSIYNLLVLLLRNHVELVLTQREYNSRIKNLERFNQILHYIENNYSDSLSIDTLCSMANMSRFYFCRLFKQVTGKTSSEYVNLIRINRAEQLLKDTDLNITEVALKVGYDNTNYFSRLFRKYKKLTPSQLRKGA